MSSRFGGNMEAKKILEKQFDSLVETLQETIRFNTEKGVAENAAPFG